PLGAFSAVCEKIEQLVSGQLTCERAEPDLQVSGGGVYGGDLQPVHIAAGDAHCVAMQVVADDAHLALHNLRIEGFVGGHPGAVDKAGVIVDSFASHNLYLADVSCNRNPQLGRGPDRNMLMLNGHLPVLVLTSERPAATRSNALRINGTIEPDGPSRS